MAAPGLRGMTGVTAHRPEDRDVAPFGRGGLVRTWRDRHGMLARRQGMESVRAGRAEDL